MVTAQSRARMSSYLVTREGQELGTFKTAKIAKGLKTGFFRLSDLGWREVSGWQCLAEIVGSGNAAGSHSNSPLMNSDSLSLPADNTPGTQTESYSAVPPIVLAALTGTKPWVRFISILMWIEVTLCALFFAFQALATARLLPPNSGHIIPVGPQSQAFATICLVFSLLILYPTLKLNKYAATIARLAESQSFSDLAVALTEQRRFWKYYGILMILCMGLPLCSAIIGFLVIRH